mmetsp:Transcript_13951/g.17617  ORF Transcript_13951/g.17617 Transcript_13951/m.17617 type:complete len:274 (-) Transcript_13951:968-1789(-)
MTTKQKPAIIWINKVFKVMKPKRCCKSSKDDKKRASIERVQDIMEHGHHHPSSVTTSSPKKQRREAENDAITDQPSTPVRPIFPPNIEFHTPPPATQVILSPPQLEQRRARENRGEAVLGHLQLPLLHIPSDDSNYGRGFQLRLNPRLEWNPSTISRHFRGTEQTLSSLLNERNAFDNNPVDPPCGRECTEVVSTSRGNVLKPIPIRRYGSATIGSSATTADYDNTTFNENTTFLRTIAEEPCCAYFCPNQYSAFDSVETRNKKSSDNYSNEG